MFKLDQKNSLVRVDQVSLRGPGVVILTGPSSCGKGEVAAALCSLMSIDRNRHLSMGEILRTTFERARNDSDFAAHLASKYDLSADVNIFSCVDTSDELSEKVHRHRADLEAHYKRDDMSEFVSQLDWLEFCTARGLLVPNRWTQVLIAAGIELTVNQSEAPFILDGYPRTVAAAQHLLAFLRTLEVPVIKVLHLSISKAEMLHRAGRRGRADDETEALRSRFEFYIENVQPSVDYLKSELGSESTALIDAHQPDYDQDGDDRVFNLQKSIANVVASALRSLGVPRIIVRDLLEDWRYVGSEVQGAEDSTKAP